MTILIVDDDARFREALKHDLRCMGYTVHAVIGLESMLDALLHATHHVALVDAHLPYGETRRICTALRHCAIPVALVVEREAESGAPRAAEVEYDHVLVKPVGLVELQRCVEQLLTRTLT